MGENLAEGPQTGGGRSGGIVADHFGFEQPEAWLDVRVFYLRVAACPLDEDAPDALTMRYPPRDIGTALEVNGGRIPPSEELRLTLRRDRVDAESAEATYVSTANFRAGGSIAFEVFDRELPLLCGNLKCSSEGEGQDAPAVAKTVWSMDLTHAVTSPECAFLRGVGKHEFSASGLGAPTMEVSAMGRCAGTPVVLTETVQLTVRRRTSIRRNMLDAIVEGDEVENGHGDLVLAAQQPEQVQLGQVQERHRNYPIITDKSHGAIVPYYGPDGTMNGYSEGDDGEVSWFNAGVRVGVGLGLGMCIGVGIGVGVMVRTYQATSRAFKRRLF